MNNFLSECEQAEVNALWEVPFETFKEKIAFYATPDRTIISTNNSQYNYYYAQNSPGLDISYVTNSGFYYGTVEYLDSKLSEKLGFNPHDSPAKQYEGVVKLTVGLDAKPYLDNPNEIITLDSTNFRQFSDLTLIGMFVRSQFSVYLRRIEP